MAAVKRFHSPYVSERGTPYNIEIWDTAYVGASTLFDPGGNGFTIHWSGEAQERLTEIIGSECTITMNLITATHDGFLTDLVSSAEGRFFLKITYGATPALFWGGVILADNSQLPDEYHPQFEISAVDGLGALKSLPYKNGTVAYFGDVRIGQHVVNCLKKLSYIADFFPVGNTLLKISVDWWESTMGAVTSTTDPFYKSWIDHATWWDYDNKGQQKFLSCYDVLKHIMTAFGARIYQVEGSFWIEQISYRNSGSFYARKYDSTLTLLGVDTATGSNTLNQTATGAKIATVEYEWYPALLYASCENLKYNRRNLLAGHTVTQSTAQIQTYNTVDSNSSNSSLRLTGNLRLNIKNVTYAGSTVDNLILIFAAKIKVGSDSVFRNYNVSNFQVNYLAAAWATDSISNWVYIGQSIWPTPASGATVHYDAPLLYITPPLTATGYLEFDLNLVAIQKFDGTSVAPGDFNISYTLDDARIEVYNFNAPDIDEDSVYHFATNDDGPTNTVHYACETRIGDSTNPNTVGRIKVGATSSSLTSAAGWGAGSDARSSILGDLLSLTILKGQLIPTQKMSGTLYGLFRLWRTYIDSESRIWLMSGGTFVGQHDQIDGEWFRLNYGLGGVSATPEKKKYDPNPHLPPSAPGGSGNNNGIGTNTELSIKPPGTVLLPVATTTLSAAKSAGAVTSIPITNTLAALDFYVGDLIALFNPVTNTFDTLTVTASSAGGETSIAVSGTLTVPYPQGSYVIKKPIIGHPSVFGHGTINKVPKWLFPNELTDSAISDSGSAVTISYLAGGGTRLLQADNSGVLTPLPSQSANTSLRGPASGGAAIPTFRVPALADYVANLLTLAKLQQIATASFVGRSTAATGDMEVLTATQATALLNVFSSALKGLAPASSGGTTNYLRADGAWAVPAGSGLAGTLTATRVPFASGASTLTDDASLTWDNTNKRLLIGTGSAPAYLNVNGGALTGTQQFFRTSANVNGSMLWELLNVSTLANANAILVIQVTGDAAGDAYTQYSVGSTTFSEGIDSSDANKWKLTLDAKPGGVLNSGLCMTAATTALVGINIDAPARPLHVNGLARSNGFENISTPPTVSFTGATGAGTGPSTTLIAGGGNCVNFNFTTGTAPTLNGNICTITLPAFYATDCVPVFSPANDTTTTHMGRFRIGGSSQNNFILVNTGTALAASTAYSLKIVVFGY